jgi:hypothetical protein
LTVNSNNISAVNSLGFRNRIINGAMVIDQRNNGASVTLGFTNQQYLLDRWFVQSSQASKFSVQRNAGSVTPPAGFTNYLGVTSLSAYSVSSSDYFNVTQTVEGFNFADLGWGTASAQTVTVSFWVRSSLTGTFGASFRNGTANRSYPFTFTINAANTWEQKSVTAAGDTSGTWATDNTAGLILTFGLGLGSNFTGTAGAWTASNVIVPTGSVSVVGTNGATFYITGVQLEAGSVATPFERRDYGRELAMCQRYYWKTYSQSAVPGTNTTDGIHIAGVTSTAAGGMYTVIRFPVVMRAAPTVTYYSVVSVVTGSWRRTDTSANTTVAQFVAANDSSTSLYSTGTDGGLASALYGHAVAEIEL